MERVIAVEGELPLLVIAPHGPDDENTGLIAEIVAEELDCYAVINNGFERADKVDYDKDKANCNNIEHCQEDVVRQEFLDPIKNYVSRIEADFYDVNIFILHGMANPKVNAPVGPFNNVKPKNAIDMVIGYGEAKSPSYSCDLWRKDAFIYSLIRRNVSVYTGKAGGQYAGAGKNNLNQFYRKWEFDDTVHSMQIEMVHDLRKDKDMARLTAETLCDALGDYLDCVEIREEGGDCPKPWAANWQEMSQQRPSY